MQREHCAALIYCPLCVCVTCSTMDVKVFLRRKWIDTNLWLVLVCLELRTLHTAQKGVVRELNRRIFRSSPWVERLCHEHHLYYSIECNSFWLSRIFVAFRKQININQSSHLGNIFQAKYHPFLVLHKKYVCKSEELCLKSSSYASKINSVALCIHIACAFFIPHLKNVIYT